MTGFEFIFSFFGLLLGLALAEALGGLTRALKSRPKVRIGWLTGLLAVFVACDLVTFWMYGWAMRELLQMNWPTMFGGFLVTALYFIAASLVFPDDVADWADLDAHFFRHRRKVLGGVLVANIVLLATVVALAGFPGAGSLRTIIITWSMFPVTLLAIQTNDRRVIIACLVWLIVLYPLSAVWH